MNSNGSQRVGMQLLFQGRVTQVDLRRDFGLLWSCICVHSLSGEKFPKCKGPIDISLWDESGDQFLGSRDWD